MSIPPRRRVREDSPVYDVQEPEYNPRAGTLTIAEPWAREGWTGILNSFIDRQDLNAGAKFVYIYLLSRVWRDQHQCMPTMGELEAATGMGEAAIRTAVVKLRDVGLLDSRRPGQGKPNVYIVSILPGTPGYAQDPDGTKSSLQKTSNPGSRTPQIKSPYSNKTRKDTSGAVPSPETPPSSATPPPSKAAVDGVPLKDLSEAAIAALDVWRCQQGKRKLPKITPPLARKLETAVVELGQERLSESAVWAALKQNTSVDSWLNAAYSKRLKDESANGHAQRSGAATANGTNGKAHPAAGPGLSLGQDRSRQIKAAATDRFAEYGNNPSMAELRAMRDANPDRQAPRAPGR